MKARFVKNTKLTATDIYSFAFATEKPVNQIAGQFTNLTLASVGSHWFTISSPPHSQYLTITTRMTGSAFKRALLNLTVGDQVDLADPMGDFVLPKDKTVPVLGLAGGIGVTPFLCILDDLANRHEKWPLKLIYAAKTKADLIDLSSYSAVADIQTITDRVTASYLNNIAGNLGDPYIYISGPEPMVEKLVHELKDLGLDSSKLVADYFPGYS